ncbi:MAG: Holliday junction branch migration protein RuvA [Candidatus Kerfeldbacteria bacterium]|jgi:holliday junction DNA helicase RuvA
MISLINGTIKYKTDKSVIVDAHGVGYEVFALPIFLEKVNKGDEVELYTHLNVREDAMELFGFLDMKEVSFFKKLISVSGVGPKSALNIMSLAVLNELQQGISQGDASLLTKVSGIGKKTAERLILELKNKIELDDLDSSQLQSMSNGDSDVIDGLMALGYTVREARDAAKAVDKDIIEVKDKIKAALKSLGRKE